MNLLAMADLRVTSYGMSKAAANWLARKISFEFRDKELMIGIVHPG